MHLLNHGQHIAKLPARVQFSSLAQTNAELNEALTCCSADEIILTESKRSDKADLFTQFSNIVCLECSEEYSDAEDFLIHILRCQFGERHVRLYRKLGVVSIRAQQLLQEAQRARAAYVGRTLSDKPSLSIITPANSRLAPFLLAGTTLSVNCPAPMFCEKCIMDPFGNRVSIYFSVNTIKKLQDDIDDYHEMRRKKKEMREYVKLLRNFELKIPDIMDTRNDLEVLQQPTLIYLTS
uniref:C2H2-type domain-containing protein n=1 Tax=Heterorhabditis bacteriophora TaxID=37862 RepID=A0A1I7WN75_HETBA